MQGKGLEYIPTRLGKPERKGPKDESDESGIESLYRRKRDSTTTISAILNMRQIVSLPFKTPECFSWFEVPLKVKVIENYTQVYQRIALKTDGDKIENTYIYKETKSSHVACLVKLQMMPSGMYNIVSVQCEYSMAGAKGFEDFLGNAWDIGISEDCKNYQELYRFLDDILTDFSGKD